MRQKKARVDLTGQKFNAWTVLGLDSSDSTYRSLYHWICRCDCGIEKSVYESHLINGKTKCCRKCSEHKHKGKLNSRHYGRIKYRAKKLNKEFTVSKQYLYDLLHSIQKCKCAISGVEIKIANTSYMDYHGGTTASLDRIDTNKGYVEGNVHWVHKWVNIIKYDFTIDEFIDICDCISEFNKSSKKRRKAIEVVELKIPPCNTLRMGDRDKP